MDPTTTLALEIAGLVALVAFVVILIRGRSKSTKENPFAASTEGEKRCAQCGMGNMWTDRTCIACGADLQG